MLVENATANVAAKAVTGLLPMMFASDGDYGRGRKNAGTLISDAGAESWRAMGQGSVGAAVGRTDRAGLGLRVFLPSARILNHLEKRRAA